MHSKTILYISILLLNSCGFISDISDRLRLPRSEGESQSKFSYIPLDPLPVAIFVFTQVQKCS
jgi:hypothetical protein